jgi:hypothetical protein
VFEVSRSKLRSFLGLFPSIKRRVEVEELSPSGRRLMERGERGKRKPAVGVRKPAKVFEEWFSCDVEKLV